MEKELENNESEVRDDIMADIEAASKELEEEAPEPEKKEEPVEVEAEESKPAEVEDKPSEGEEKPPEEEKADDEPPYGWGAAVKSKWGELPEDVRAEISKRENEIHQALTRHDGDLRFGRELKEVVNPYMPLIQAKGITPAAAINTLLNTSYILNTGTDEQKKEAILETAKHYGVDLGLPEGEGEYEDPEITKMRQKLDELQKQASPEAIQNNLRQQMIADKIDSDIAAFASDPANVHFETVRPLMATILQSGQAENLKEAYDMACMANPAIRSELLKADEARKAAERKKEIEAKKNAASSVSGSPATPSNSKKSTIVNESPEDTIRRTWEELENNV